MVGSTSIDVLPCTSGPSGSAQPPSYRKASQPIPAYVPPSYHTHHRPSLPTLQTRSGVPMDFDSQSQYDPSPVDPYPYPASASAPRQDSFSSQCELPNYRSWNAVGQFPATLASSPFYDTQGYGFAATAGASFTSAHHPQARVASIGVDSMATLNMGHLNTSLPLHSAPARRLPVPAPFTCQGQTPQTSHSATDVPATHHPGRRQWQWSRNPSAASFAPVHDSSIDFAHNRSLPVASAPQQATSTFQGPGAGHRSAVTSVNNCDPSPTTSNPTLSDSFPSSSASVSHISLAPTSFPTQAQASAAAGEYPRGHHGHDYQPPSGFYSLHTESGGECGVDHIAAAEQPPRLLVQQPQPQHLGGVVDILRRQASFERPPSHPAQAPSPSSAQQRMSVSNLSVPY